MDIEYLKDSIQENEILQKKDKKLNYLNDTLLNVVENFMKKNKRICYGGTAINSILPKEKQFYNYDIDIPDYDFFSPNALEDAKKLCNLFKKENIFHVEGKNAISFGTYKVFVNFVPIADITQIHETFYNFLLSISENMDGILYTPPSYLRMSLHQELARPKGDVSRWEKVYNRLQLLNTYFPILTKPIHKNQHMFLNIKLKAFENQYDTLLNHFIKHKNVFCNFHLVACVYKKYFKTNKCFQDKRDFFIIYSEDLESCIKNINKLKLSFIKVKKEESIYKFIGDYAFLFFKDKLIGILFQTNSCLSYIETTFNKKTLHVGNIDTLLNLYFSLILMDFKKINYPLMLSFIGELNKIVVNYDKTLQSKNNKNIQRFKMPCLGEQEDLPKILRIKQRKFKELRHNKSSIEYKKWFFKYTPNLSNKTKNMKKKKNNKTKKK